MDHYAANNASLLNTGQLIYEGKDMLNIACLNHTDGKIPPDTVMDDKPVAKDNENNSQICSAARSGVRDLTTYMPSEKSALLFQSDQLKSPLRPGTPTPPTSPPQLESPFKTPEVVNKSKEIMCNLSHSATPGYELEILSAQPQDDYKIKMPLLRSPINMPPSKSDQMVEEAKCSSIRPPQTLDHVSQSLPVKRLREDSSDLTSTGINDSNPRPTKHICTPKSVPVSLKYRHSKLMQPFRSPLLEKSSQPVADTNNRVSLTPIFKVPSQPLCGLIPSTPEKKSNTNVDSQPKSDYSIKRSHALKKPFKSPFKSPLASLSVSTQNIISSPNIQAMERKSQLLKRAIKIREVDEENKLEELTKKWTTVGREVAWELWAIVKDQASFGGWTDEPRDHHSVFGGRESTLGRNLGKQHSVFDLNWGFADENQKPRDEEELSPSPSKLEEAVWKSIRQTTKKPLKLNLDLTIDTLSDKDEEKAAVEETILDESKTMVQAHTLGTMLRSFGVTDEILGWNDAQEDFVDV